MRSMKIMRLEKTKKELLGKILRIQEELGKEQEGEEKEQI
jgi:hypothetical protein